MHCPEAGNMETTPAHLEEVLIQTSERTCTILAVLKQLKDPEVGAAFLRGEMLSCADLKEMLILLRGLYDVLMPPWCGDPGSRAESFRVAGTHMKNLICESTEIFEIPTDYAIRTRYSYKAWFKAIGQLSTCPYFERLAANDSL